MANGNTWNPKTRMYEAIVSDAELDLYVSTHGITKEDINSAVKAFAHEGRLMNLTSCHEFERKDRVEQLERLTLAIAKGREVTYFNRIQVQLER